MAPTTLFSSRPYTSILLLLWLVNSVSCSHNTVNKDASCALYPRGYQCLTRNAFIWCDNAANYTFDCPYGTSCDFLFSTSFPCVGTMVQPQQTSISRGYYCDPLLCQLPNCKCASNESPRPPADTPQLVMLTFDGRITESTLDPVRKVIFEGGELLNPNDCPIKTTWFAPFIGSTADSVLEYIRRGHELGARTYNDTINPEPRDIAEARRSLAGLFDGFSESEIVGFRTPDLKFTYPTFSYLKDLKFLYDASIPEQSFNPFSPLPTKKLWPYTLDFGVATNCFIGSCNLDYTSNSSRQQGLWSIPMYTLDNTDNSTSDFGIAQTVFNPIGDITQVRKLWVDNFLAHYNGNRAPFGLWLTPGWLIESADRIQLLRQFISDILSLGDVWLVSGSDVIKYMKNSMTTKEMNETKITPFDCPKPRTSIRKAQFPALSIESEQRIPWIWTAEETDGDADHDDPVLSSAQTGFFLPVFLHTILILYYW